MSVPVWLALSLAALPIPALSSSGGKAAATAPLTSPAAAPASTRVTTLLDFFLLLERWPPFFVDFLAALFLVEDLDADFLAAALPADFFVVFLLADFLPPAFFALDLLVPDFFADFLADFLAAGFALPLAFEPAAFFFDLVVAMFHSPCN
ncbi:MAG: hypothetical protein M3371_03080 [Acidobacteriota bacterium]|nr:hypothetical protein [Acidobacteriota bacterium]